MMFALLGMLLACGGSEPTVEAPAEDATAAVAAPAAEQKSDWKHYGEAFAVDKTLPVAAVLDGPDSLLDTQVRIEGQVQNVCQKMGCWMVLADEKGRYLRVTMKDHAFGVDTDTPTGPNVLGQIEGTLIGKELTPDELAHLQSEAKGGAEQVAKEVGQKVEIVATGVAIRIDG